MLKQYIKDSSGQFAIMVALVVSILMLCVGVAVDLSIVHRHKVDLQNLTDSAVLSAAASRDDNIGNLKTLAQAAIDANNIHGLDIKIKTTLDDNDVVRVEASASYPTHLMKLFGYDSLPYNSVSEAPLPKEVPLNIALVLDTTQSMAEGNNMSALQTASATLLNIFDSSSPGIIQAGVVPYGEYVNVGLANRNRPWMDVEEDSTTEKCYTTKDIISQDCTSDSYEGTCYNDSGPYTCTKSSSTCTNQVYGPEYEKCYDSVQTWNGCVGSRNDPDHKDPGYKGRQFPGIMNVTCGSEILDLTSDLNTVENHINSLTTDGWTYTPAGVAWGWRMLDPDIPYGGLTNSQDDRKRAMVLMSDGANTVRLNAPYHSRHYGPFSDQELVDTNSLTLELCQGAKDAGIEIYSVAYNLPSAEASAVDMIRNCASTPQHFFQADNADELEAAFTDIANSLFQVRLSR